jgi:hypothetical protein
MLNSAASKPTAIRRFIGFASNCQGGEDSTRWKTAEESPRFTEPRSPIGVLAVGFACRSSGDPELDGHDGAQRLDSLVRELRSTFPEMPAAQVHDVVLSTWRGFLGAPVRDFVPLLVPCRAISHLRMV